MPQIEQLAATYASQIFWLLVFFGVVFFVIGRGAVPKVLSTMDGRDKQIADDLAAAEAARAAAERRVPLHLVLAVDLPQREVARVLLLVVDRDARACLQLVDARERELPDVGLVALEDAESGEIREVDTGSADVRARFAAAADARLTGVATTLGRAGVDVARLDPDAAIAPTLSRFFERRRRR